MPAEPSVRCPGPLHRRSILKAGVLGLSGLSLPDLYRLRAQAAEAGTPARDTAVIFVFLDGGPPHLDMYDLKPAAPREYRGAFRGIETNVPGIEIGELLPEQARHMDRLAVIRSFTHTTSDHIAGTAWLMSGYFGPTFERQEATYPAAGSIVARLREEQSKTIPPYVSISNGDRGYMGAAYLGVAYDPFRVSSDPNSASFAVENLKLASSLSIARLDNRRKLLAGLDRMRRDSDVHGTAIAMDKFQQRAHDIVTGPQAQKAFDLSREDEKTRDRYGRHTWGQRMLLARRLVEAGVSFVTVTMSTPQGGWDLHENLEPRLREMAPIYDRALAALLEDLTERGLYDRVAVCVAGEFGRSPVITRDVGRDHWGRAGFALLGGAGLKGGQVIGSTTSKGEEPKDRPVGPEDILATLYRVLGIDTRVSFLDNSGRPHRILNAGEPIRELIA